MNFKIGNCVVWGIQYHPEITYSKMISLINFRKDRLISKQAFKDDIDINNHIKMIKKEENISDINLRMQELKNWVNYLNDN